MNPDQIPCAIQVFAVKSKIAGKQAIFYKIVVHFNIENPFAVGESRQLPVNR